MKRNTRKSKSRPSLRNGLQTRQPGKNILSRRSGKKLTQTGLRFLSNRTSWTFRLPSPWEQNRSLIASRTSRKKAFFPHWSRCSRKTSWNIRTKRWSGHGWPSRKWPNTGMWLGMMVSGQSSNERFQEFSVNLSLNTVWRVPSGLRSVATNSTLSSMTRGIW